MPFLKPTSPLPPVPRPPYTAGGAGQRANNYIEELTLGPGVERTLHVYFCAAPPVLDAAGAAGACADDEDDPQAAVAAVGAAAGGAAASSAAGKGRLLAPVSSQERGGGSGSCGSAATARGTKLAKQAFKLFFACQEPRGQWDDGESVRMFVDYICIGIGIYVLGVCILRSI